MIVAGAQTVNLLSWPSRASVANLDPWPRSDIV